jgi:ATP-dependent Clp protease ATP-binding subunit ClpB
MKANLPPSWTSSATDSANVSHKLDVDKPAKSLLAKEGYDPIYGARPLRRTIQKEILDPLSIDILEGKVREGQTVHVDAKNGPLEFKAR